MTRMLMTAVMILLFVQPGAPVLAANFGSGMDGALTVGGTFLVDAVRTNTSDVLGSGATSLNVGSTAGFAVGDELLIMSAQGSGAPGTFEFAHVSGISGSTLQLSGGLSNAYNGGADAVMVQRVPNYTDVTVQAGATLTASPWDGSNGGIVAFRASGTVSVDATGAISADGLGFRGGAALTGQLTGNQGESFTGVGGQNFVANGGAGGGGRFVTSSGDVGGGGGGGSYGTAGSDGGEGNGRNAQGFAGTTYGSSFPSDVFLGSGGGGGGADIDGGGSGFSGAGGTGGGIVYFQANQLNLTGIISAAGASGGNDSSDFGSEAGGGGGGSGGSVIVATTSGVSVFNVAFGGGGGGLTNSGFALDGGVGGLGRAEINGVVVPSFAVDFTQGTSENFAPTGGFVTPNWSVSSGGSTVAETTNSHPTVFYTQESILGTRITGTITPGSDDDVFGLALGFNPGDTSNTAADYLLLDWKRVTQAFDFTGGVNDATAGTNRMLGLALSEVTGVPSADELWGHVNDAGNADGGVSELARGLTLGSAGYSASGSHDFEILYESDRVQIFVDGVLQFDMAGIFGDGRLGLYEHSQSPGGIYSDFRIAPLDFNPIIPGISQQVPEPSSMLVWLLVGALIVGGAGRLHKPTRAARG